MAAERFDAVVVGAGIMGSCAAFELSHRGLSVLLLDQFDLLHHLGSSHGESRTIRATYPEPYYTPMAILSHRLWQAAESLSGIRVLTPTPHLDVGPVDCPSLRLAISHCKTHSVPHRILDSDQLASEFSAAFRIPDDWIAVVSDLGGVLKPTKAVSMFQSLARSHGAVTKDRVKVTGIRRLTPDVIAVSAEKGVEFHAGKVVIAAGAWSRKLMREVAGLKLPIQPLHTTMCYWKVREGHEAELTPEGGFPTFSSYGEPFIYGTPSLDYPGLIKVALHRGRECDPDRRCWTTDMEDMEKGLRPFVEQVLGGRVDAAEGPVITQACMYSMTPDGDYVIDYVGGELGRDVVVAAGFSGHGFKMGPLVGKVVAEMVVGEEVTDVEVHHFRAGRFEEEDGYGNRKNFENPIPVGCRFE